MLLTVELFDSVAGLVVLAENVLLLGFVKGRLIVPGSGLGAGSSTIEFLLQNVDCTRNDRRVRNKDGHRHPSRKVSVPSSTASDAVSKRLASATEGIAKR